MPMYIIYTHIFGARAAPTFEKVLSCMCFPLVLTITTLQWGQFSISQMK